MFINKIPSHGALDKPRKVEAVSKIEPTKKLDSKDLYTKSETNNNDSAFALILKRKLKKDNK